VKINTIPKIRKYKGLHEGHHFIPMAMEVRDAPKHDMDCFFKELAHFFHDRGSKDHLSLSFCIQFFRQCVNITFQHVLASVIKRKIELTFDACSRPLVIIRSHDLHANDI
jgi:hypothetical protein